MTPAPGYVALVAYVHTVVVIVVVVVVLALTRIIKSVITGQAPVTLSGGEEYPTGLKHKQTKSGARIYHS